MLKRLFRILVIFLLALSLAQAEPATFDGVAKWGNTLSAAKVSEMKSLYSTTLPAELVGPDKKQTPDMTSEFDFWQKIFVSGASDVAVNIVESTDQDGFHVANLEISLKVDTPNGPRTRYVLEHQVWQKQTDGWRIVIANHSGLTKMRPALNPNPHLYDDSADAKAEIKEAVAKAAAAHQRVILVFGGNWCYDCHILDQAFHQPDIAPIVEKNFQVVHVDVGLDGKRNSDVAESYKVPAEKGVPALAILGPDGKLLYSQRNGEWESARSLDPDDVIAFLNKWKPE